MEVREKGKSEGKLQREEQEFPPTQVDSAKAPAAVIVCVQCLLSQLQVLFTVHCG